MKKLIFLGLVLALVGCGTTSPLIVAEKTLTASLDTTSAVVQADYEEAALCRPGPVTKACSKLEAAIPGTHAVANDIREVYPPILTACNQAVSVYRQALATYAALQASKTATTDQIATANAAVDAALSNLNGELLKLAPYTARALSVWTSWKGGTK